MQNSKEIANFFWHGNSLSIYEIGCIKSFIVNDFEVNVWTFNPNLNVPEGATICDANKFYSVSDIMTFSQRGKQGCLAAFSDAFRYKVLAEIEGWWFDTDCLCLRPQEDFKDLYSNRSIIAGYENSRNLINGAVLRFLDNSLLNAAIKMMEEKLVEKNRHVSWGEIGPKLITKLVENNNLHSNILPISYFYPIHCKSASDAINPEKLSYMENKCSTSYVYHCWNEMLSRAGVDKTTMPPSGSFLHKKFKELF
jgi:hypothetical protein